MLIPLVSGPPWVHVWPRIDVVDGEILVQADGRGDPVTPDTTRTKVRVVGPKGPEPALLVPTSLGKDRPSSPLVLRVTRTPDAGWREVTIDVKDTVANARFPEGSIGRLRYYLPATETAEADRRLRSEMLGKPVWVLGSAVVPDHFGTQDRSADQVGWDPRLPAAVIGVERRSLPLRQIDSADCWDLFGGWETIGFYAANPLTIRLRLPTHGRYRLSGSIGGEMGWSPDPSPGWATEASVVVADPWQLARRFAPSPDPLLQGEKPAVARAFSLRKLALGMPRALVAYILGDPEAGAPRDQVWHRPAWSWSDGFIGTYFVVFDAHDRVANFGVDWAKLP